jgi:hypothetical protein
MGTLSAAWAIMQKKSRKKRAIIRFINHLPS